MPDIKKIKLPNSETIYDIVDAGARDLIDDLTNDDKLLDKSYEVGFIEPSAKDGDQLFTSANNKIYVR